MKHAIQSVAILIFSALFVGCSSTLDDTIRAKQQRHEQQKGVADKSNDELERSVQDL